MPDPIPRATLPFDTYDSLGDVAAFDAKVAQV